ncbi:MAG: tRNA 2-thiouridine(34) synthase MnmA [Bacilli bacterium]|nr:tRNA 2-thiouridine(34) synthase MnmA [Bacilli bacterium]
MERKTVAIGMSGGVDSSVAACLLKDKGYNVIGVTLELLDNEETKKSIEDAKAICKKIDIKHYVCDLKEEFKEEIVQNFITAYKQGKTPNPCVLCNRLFKFGLFYKKALELGADYISTGHYARVKNNRLMMSLADGKDQSYFLCQIKKEILPKVLFPLNEFQSKEEIRTLARKYQLPVSEKKDSQEVCFIPNDDYKTFLKKNGQEEVEGKIILTDKTVLGNHKGLFNYTIGQRKGLNISYKEPLYVIQLDIKNNNLIVGTNNELFNQELIATNMNYLVEKDEFFKTKLFAKIRSRGNLEEVDTVTEEQNRLKIKFKNKLRAITPGQLIVFYNENKECLGGAYIEK